ncbi:MAG: hypothetical protein IKW67_00980 [Alphaproteobacteria bacterium]|nr:hypothetical protein [Alphaproteobacteria bacterium]
MSFLQKITGLIAFIGLIPAADAVTARPGVMNAANVLSATGVSAAGSVRRMPTMTAYINGGAISGGTTGSTGTTSSSSSLMGDIDCIESYTECMKSDDACGTDFEECTTNVLFHAQMPNCVSVLAQCKTSGINSLFGTSNVSALSNVATSNTHGEVTKYTYPTDGSVMGQAIIAAAIENKYDVQTCVKRYTNCLHRDDVCGPDFELCTSERDLKKQALFCDSTLARCPADGVIELFGTATWRPSNKDLLKSGRIKELIEDGASLAAANAVSTCYKVVDRCFLGACAANPLRCIEGTSVSALQAAQGIVTISSDGVQTDENGNLIKGNTTMSMAIGDTLTQSEINRYLRSSCVDTIGSNKYCHMTYFGKMPKDKDLLDSDLVADVFAEAYNSRRAILESKVQGLMQDFDAKAKKKCSETIKSCAMRSCGGGSGAACYSQVFGGTEKSIAADATYGDIRTGCEALTNTDKNCVYAVQSLKTGDSADYSYVYADAGAFETLFPKYDADNLNTNASDPIGVIGELNGLLASSYNDTAIAQMRRSCQLVAEGCVRNMCGTEFENCYRRRTDVMSSLTKTGESAFDDSMNKVDGVLDYGTILGMCVGTVKGADACAEHLAISKAKEKTQMEAEFVNLWGTASSVRDGWLGAGNQELANNKVQKTDGNGAKICSTASGAEGPCNTLAPDNAPYMTPVMLDRDVYAFDTGANNLFKELIYDLEIEAQAKYKAALTKEQNMCMSYNQGGIRGAMDNQTYSPYMWVKLKNGNVPSDYATNGLTDSNFVASNDLFGSFCRARVDVTSTDNLFNTFLIGKTIDGLSLTETEKKDTTRYFAVGDTFTCGSWISPTLLEKLSKIAGQNARTKEKESQLGTGAKAAIGIASMLGGGVGGVFLGDKIQDKMSGSDKKDDVKDVKKQCKNNVDNFVEQVGDILSKPSEGSKIDTKNADLYFKNVKKYCESLDGVNASFSVLKTKWENWKKDYNACTYSSSSSSWICGSDRTDIKDTVVKTAAEGVKAAADVATKLEGKDSDKNKGWQKNKGKILGGLTTAAVTGLGSWGIMEVVQGQKLDKAEQEAIQVFMDEIGSKIQCVVGGNTIVNYGDTITLTLE